jgi:hypothetical protein
MPRRSIALPAAGLLLAFTAACSGELSRSHARALLDEAPSFATPSTYTLREGHVSTGLSRPGPHDDEADAWRALAEQGLLILEDGGEVYRPMGTSYHRYTVTLTETGRAAFEPQAENRWSAPVARKRVVEVTGISRISETLADVEYTWTYEAVTPLGETLLPAIGLTPDALGAPRPGRALLRKFDDGWRAR